jgi:hypothetical protein
LNLAACHEAQGKLATAWEEYASAASMAHKTGDDREAFALQEEKRVEPHVPHVVITADAVPTGLVVKLDGTTMSAAALGTPIPVDLGEHQVEATAPHRVSWHGTVNVVEAGKTATVRVPALAEEVHVEPKTDWEHPVGWSAIAVGVVGVGLGTYFGLRAFSLKHDADPYCVNKQCNDTGLGFIDRAQTAATWSTVSFGVGVAGLAAGAWILLTADPSAPPESTAGSTKVHVAPIVGGGFGGVSIGGAF